MGSPMQLRRQLSSAKGQERETRSRSAAASHAGPVPVEHLGSESICELYRTKVWLQGQIKETRAASIAAKNKEPPSSDDPEKLLERITILQAKLLEASTNNSLKELQFRRLQLGQALEENLFPKPVRSDAGDMPQGAENQRTLLPLVEKQAEYASEVLRLHKLMEDFRPDLAKKQKTKLEQIHRNRELMANIQHAKENLENKRKNFGSDKSHIQKAQEKLEKVLSNITLLQHIFQGLIVGSGVNWAKDPKLMELIISMGQPPPLDP